MRRIEFYYDWEDGDDEEGSGPSQPALLNEDGSFILNEDGSFILLE